MENKKLSIAKVKSIGYNITNGIVLELEGYNYTHFVKPKNIKYGGKNCEISDLRTGGKIAFVYDTVASVRNLENVTIISDGIREIDLETGELIKW